MHEFLSIFRNRSFRIHIVMYICVYSAMDFLMALFSYYLTYYLRRPGLYSMAMGTLMIVQLAMIVVYVYIANSKGKRFACIMGGLLWLAGMLATELARLRAGGSPDDVAPDVRVVCERVSGVPYGAAFRAGADRG